MIECMDISFSYPNCRNKILDGISLRVEDGSFVCLLGTNGAGKSTLVNILSGYVKSDCGKVLLNGIDTAEMSPRALAQSRAVLEQSTQPAFNPAALELAASGRYAHSNGFGFSDKDIEAARECLKLVGLGGFENRLYETLSGGEKRRVNIARTLAQIYDSSADYSGKTLLLDEPCSALDPAHALLALRLAKILSSRGAAVLCVLHDPNQAFRFADRICIMKDAKIFAQGGVCEIADAEVLSRAYGVKCKIIFDELAAPFAVFE